ncbi:MAG: hypothetical protein HY741_17170 [Chloroflexi bacterium]|nr:hypothetical protein [Chloroflexota bacterium]
MTVLLTLLPALCLLGGALLYLVPLGFISRYRTWLPVLANMLAAAAVVYLARGGGEPTALVEPSAILPGLTLALQWSGAALPFGLVLLLFTSARLLMGAEEDSPAFVVGTLVVNGGALLFLAADNWTTLAAAWILVELGLLVVPVDDSGDHTRAVTAFGWNLAGVVLWLSAGLMLSNQGQSLRLQDAALAELPALLVMLAIWIRSGLYPLHAATASDVPGAAVRLGIPMLLGGYLLTRFLTASQGAMAFSSELQIMAVFAVGISALLVVGQPHGADAFIWLARAFGANLLLLPFLGNAQTAAALSVWLTLSVFALCVIQSIAWSWRAQLPRVPLPALVWLVVLVLVAGLPLAPAFWGRVGLLSVGYMRGLVWWLLLTAGAALSLIPVWREIFASREVAPKAPSRFEYAALAVVVLTVLGMALASDFFMQPFGPAVRTSAQAPLNELFKPSNSTVLIFVAAGLLVPPLFAFELARRWAQRASLLPAQFTTLADLSGLAHALDFVYRLVRALVQQSMAVLEQPPIAWLIFLGIWVAVWASGLGR